MGRSQSAWREPRQGEHANPSQKVPQSNLQVKPTFFMLCHLEIDLNKVNTGLNFLPSLYRVYISSVQMEIQIYLNTMNNDWDQGKQHMWENNIHLHWLPRQSRPLWFLLCLLSMTTVLCLQAQLRVTLELNWSRSWTFWSRTQKMEPKK